MMATDFRKVDTPRAGELPVPWAFPATATSDHEAAAGNTPPPPIPQSDKMKRSARYACARVSLESLRGQSRRRRDRPMTKTTYLGLDVHAATIVIATLEEGQERPEITEIATIRRRSGKP